MVTKEKSVPVIFEPPCIYVVIDVHKFQFFLNMAMNYAVHTPANALFINLVKSFKFTLKYTIISLLLRSFDCWAL